MSNLMGLLRVGASSLATQQTGIAVAGNNIANAQTTGYSRRSVTIEEGRGVVAGGGSITAGVTRAEDFVLSQQLSAQQGLLSQAQRGSRALTDVESAFQSGQASLSQSVTNLAQSFSLLSAAPGDLTRRTDAIQKGQQVVLDFNRTGAQLAQLRQANQQSARDLAPAINQAATQLAALNRSILGGPPGSLPPSVAGANNRNLDQRDVAAQKLADLSGGQLLRNQDGTYDILVGGLALVHGATAQSLAITPNANGALQVSVGGHAVQGDVDGQLGGVLDADAISARTQAQLDQLAFDLSNAINGQHALGVGLDGQGGRPFFAVLGQQAGAATQLKIDPNLTAERVAAGFTAAPGDNRNAAALANLIDQPVLDGGKSNFQNFYANIVSTLGFEVQRAQDSQSSAQGRQAALTTQQQSISGVSTDEEMTQVLAFQRAFESSSRFLRAVDETIQDLLAIKK